MPPPANGKRFELVVQDDFLVVRHPKLAQCLLLPRGVATAAAPGDDASLALSVDDAADFQHLQGRRMSFDAIYGIFWLLRGPYLALVTQSRVVGRGVGDHELRLVQKLELLLLPTQQLPQLTPTQEADEATYLDMLTRDIEAQRLHFAPEYDLTHSLQRISSFDAKSGGIAERADRRFCWNYGVCGAFLDKKLFDWITPMVQAHVEVTSELSAHEARFKIVYISRRSCRRQGTRFTMRGIDDNGDVANFVETEQICVFADGRQTSFVQIRGSIPIFWSSPVSMKYAPTVYQRGQPDKDVAAFQRHAYELLQLYGRVVIVNLIDKKKEQRQLGEALAKTLTAAATADAHLLANVRLVWFDFHHECRNMQWGNLDKLIHMVDDDFMDYGYFSRDKSGRVTNTQSGVVRTNCMDNLDRTNVVQSLFARRSLLLQLNASDALQGDVLNSPFDSLERVFKDVWGNNADAISMLYAGTGALKTDFTRTGKRTKQGALQDGYNSCMRYLINNFMDGARQDTVDLLLGRHLVSRSKPSPFQGESEHTESVESLVAKLMGMVGAFFLLESMARSSASSNARGIVFLLNSLVRAVAWSAVSCTVVFAFTVKKGNALGHRLVRLPRFRPQDGCMVAWKNY